MPSPVHRRDIDAALKHCASELVHIPGHIQPHGALIAVDKETLEIRYASATTVDFLRVRHDRLLGMSLKQVFGRRTRDSLESGIVPAASAQQSRDLGLVTLGANAALVTSAQAGALTIFEFEHPRNTEISGFAKLNELNLLLTMICTASTRQTLFDASVRFLSILTGYDRVTVYALDGENNGTVVSEVSGVGVKPFLGLRFPAWDIPPQARQMMLKLPLRYIADVDAVPAPLHAADPRAPELDLTHAHLRGVSPVHMEFLRNMDVQSTMSLNIVLGDRLWGMISLQHRTARFPGQSVRRFCSSFAELFSQRLSEFLHREKSDYLLPSDKPPDYSADNFAHINGRPKYDSPKLAQLTRALGADGVVLLQNEIISTCGHVPEVAKVCLWKRKHIFPNGVTTTSNLARDYPDLAADLGPAFAGLLVVRSDALTFLFFRTPTKTAVSWAGAPEKSVQVKNGAVHLTPRTSFAECRLVTMHTSLPWTIEHCCIADALAVGGFPEVLGLNDPATTIEQEAVETLHSAGKASGEKELRDLLGKLMQ